MSNEKPMYEPKNVRPRDGWVVVLAEPRKEKLASGLFLAPNETGLEKVSDGAGRVIRSGRGEKNDKIGLKEGQRVVYRGYLKHANPIPCEETWEDGQKKTYFIMSSDDVYAIIDEDVDVGVYSGRPQVPAKE